MLQPEKSPALVTTIRERCRVCYTCVRKCPAQAIRIADGQAEVLAERCIGCGNCVRVCSQHAKQVQNGVEKVERLLAGDGQVAALLAPSFPAEFSDLTPGQLVGMVRALGFTRVVEVAFGADLVADRYRILMAQDNGKRYIASTCPAVIGYVERYHPELVENLAPFVSPMVATARALRHLLNEPVPAVFIGPCIAKKGEAASRGLAGEVDEALTFGELRAMFKQAGLEPADVAESDFDPPHGSAGALFALSGGLLQTADLREDLLAEEVVTAQGQAHFTEALNEFAAGTLQTRLLEILCCHGCISGAGVENPAPLFTRRSRVSRYARERLARLDLTQWKENMALCAELDLEREFEANDQRSPQPSPELLAGILHRMGKFYPEDELNCGACGYATCVDHAQAIFKGLAETEMCLPNLIDQLHATIVNLDASHRELEATRAALIQSEKLASMGQLAAGIAHEVNNPLGVVLMYAHLLREEQRNNPRLREDLGLIAEQADRCKKIVSGLLHFARQNKVVRQPVNVPELVQRCLRALPERPGLEVRTEVSLDDPYAALDADQITQVLTNLIGNACDAMEAAGGVLTLSVSGDEREVVLRVIDTGPGIPESIRDKIFEPFFTTKQIGKGTGLGLAVTYGIVKMHRGALTVESNADDAAGPTGAIFTVRLPRKGEHD